METGGNYSFLNLLKGLYSRSWNRAVYSVACATNYSKTTLVKSYSVIAYALNIGFSTFLCV